MGKEGEVMDGDIFFVHMYIVLLAFGENPEEVKDSTGGFCLVR